MQRGVKLPAILHKYGKKLNYNITKATQKFLLSNLDMQFAWEIKINEFKSELLLNLLMLWRNCKFIISIFVELFFF